MKDKYKFLLIILTIILVFIIGFYFIKPLVDLSSGIHVSLDEIVNKYYMNKDETMVFLFNKEIASYYSKENSSTFLFTLEEGKISSKDFNFFVINSSKLWFIEGNCYFYEVNR